ncbi:MAG: glycosyltransferase family 39 protein, partial [Acidobacteriia bacterium]|nr:glycosyltransferase family 39 protein [Terriglobia bacterium]
MAMDHNGGQSGQSAGHGSHGIMAALVQSGGAVVLSPRVLRAAGFAAVVALLAVRFLALGRTPPGVYVDEASYGYNALAIAESGRDEHGVRFPVFFEAFGEYKSPVFIYALAALVKLLGPSVATVRLCAALFAAGAAVFTALAVVETTRRRAMMLPTLLLGLAVPWTFTLGRFATESVSFAFLIALAWWTWLRAVRTGSTAWFAASWTGWGLSLFSYGTARLLTPVLVVALVAAHARALLPRAARCAAGTLPGVALALLYGAWAAAHPGALSARFDEVSIFRDGPGLGEAAARVVGNYVRCFSLDFLFLRGDPNLRHHTGVGGELYLFMLPALVAGVAVAVKARRDPGFRFALAGLVLFPAAAALTSGSPNAIRTINAVPFVVGVAAIGLREFFSLLHDRRWVLAALAVLAGLETIGFVGDYFIRYPVRSAPWFNAGLPKAVEAALAIRGPAERAALAYSPAVFMDDGAWINQPYVFFLFCGRLSPEVYQQRGLTGFRIVPWGESTVIPSGSILLVKSAERLF